VTPRSRAASLRRLVAAALLTLPLTSCGVSGLSFVQDQRLSITAPADRAKVDLPLTVRWTVEDFDVKAGAFGVFVDRPPLPPGKKLDWLARGDEVCSATPGCPDAAYLATHDTYRTRKTQFTIEKLPDLDRDEQREFHEVTIVLLDDDGERIGESAFSVEFEVDREDA
jgi:hypothetical protein